MTDTYRKLWRLLDAHERRRAILLGFLILITGFAEAVGVASVLPFMAVLNTPELIETNAQLAALHAWSGIEDTQAFMRALGFAMLGFLLLSLFLKALTNYANQKFADMRGYTLSSRLLTGYLDQPYAWFLGRHSSALTRTIFNDVAMVVSNMLLPAVRLFTQGAIILFLVALLMLVNPVGAATGALVLGGCYAIIFTVLRKRVLRYGREALACNTARYKIAGEALGGVKDLKILGATHIPADRFRGPARRMAELNAASALIGSMPRFALEALVFGGMLGAALYLMGQGPDAVRAALPLLGLYALAGARLFPALQGFYGAMVQLRSGTALLDNLHADLEEIRRQSEPEGRAKAAPMGLRQSLTMHDVRYAYPNAERAALEGLDLEIRANTSVGIVGASGAGKTTALDVMLGLLAPQSGALKVDGVEITRANRRAWQDTVGYVPQSIFLIDDTVAANIAFGMPPGAIDMAAVERAGRMAELHDFVTRELPDGYATMVGERGVRLSGGQRQRIGIARALYRDPDVLFLDEATAALDNITERAVMDAVRNLGGRKTVVMIAHRLTTVMGCDEIFLLERGRVAARGTYGQLVETNPVFRRMAGGEAA